MAKVTAGKRQIEDYARQFPSKMEAARRSAGFTQRDVCAHLGIGLKTLTNWASGATMPDIAQVFAMSRLFGVGMEYWDTEKRGMEPRGIVASMQRDLDRIKRIL